ncbi:hypothetical protein C8034_v010928 [Colletotrichum sidae]|uniref:Uncharacterized protein n=1 Tax=Colletotrichum sidae TaxID=1347389 RepID=A0A4R8TJ74_9PEZI|nr:hypothetical protein C8034_v010928 [Colletotrichum sidae]
MSVLRGLWQLAAHSYLGIALLAVLAEFSVKLGIGHRFPCLGGLIVVLTFLDEIGLAPDRAMTIYKGVDLLLKLL